ncbi:MAG: glucose 1-dehydrogenase [Alphaproteobacteria bacterium]|nr:glucose 1-dehydrogenase [Alphaproteobacteria bacterium]
MTALAGKIALITGAAGDIGAAIARRFVKEGATVCLADIDQDRGTALAEELGSPAFFISLDVTKEEDWRVALETLASRHERLDILVNNAGTLETGTIEDTNLALWQNIQSTNATSTFLGCQAAVRAMKQTGGGVIVNMASQAAVRPRPSTLAYSASKAAIVNLTKTVASHCADNAYNIRCNVMMPGAIDTQMIYKNQTDDESAEEFVKAVNARYPMGRMGTADEIASGVVFLSSDESRFMTGAQLRVDGGGTI